MTEAATSPRSTPQPVAVSEQSRRKVATQSNGATASTTRQVRRAASDSQETLGAFFFDALTLPGGTRTSSRKVERDDARMEEACSEEERAGSDRQ